MATFSPTQSTSGLIVQRVFVQVSQEDATTTNSVLPGDVIPGLTVSITMQDPVNNFLYVRVSTRSQNLNAGGSCFVVLTVDGVEIPGSGGHGESTNALDKVAIIAEGQLQVSSGARLVEGRFLTVPGTHMITKDDARMIVMEIAP